MRGLVRIAVLAFCALAAGALSGVGVPPAAALVDTPSLTITSPADGSVINDPTPAFRGTSTAEEIDEPPLSVWVYNQAGDRVLELKVEEPGQAWTVGPGETPLGPGTYTAKARQRGALDWGEASITFSVDTKQPRVSISAPPSGSATSGESLAFSGSAGTEAGDLPTVTLEVFSGPAASGPSLAALTVQAQEGSWSVVVGGLGPGTYTAQAAQGDSAGNVGRSTAVTFTMTGPSPPPAPAPPVASFRWFPSSPSVGQTVALVSSSTDAFSPITAYAWDLAGSGPFKPGGPVVNTSFATPGRHTVRLRVTDARGAASSASQTITVSPAAIALMQPFPIVRIAGTETAFGVRLSQLTVLTPIGATVTVTCRGHGCKLRAQSQLARASKRHKRAAVLLSFRRFQRALRAGVVLEIRVAKTGRIGKYTRFSIRRHRLPARLDRCLAATNPKPIECPA
jgi:hypothetical protein